MKIFRDVTKVEVTCPNCGNKFEDAESRSFIRLDSRKGKLCPKCFKLLSERQNLTSEQNKLIKALKKESDENKKEKIKFRINEILNRINEINKQIK